MQDKGCGKNKKDDAHMRVKKVCSIPTDLKVNAKKKAECLDVKEHREMEKEVQAK